MLMTAECRTNDKQMYFFCSDDYNFISSITIFNLFVLLYATGFRIWVVHIYTCGRKVVRFAYLPTSEIENVRASMLSSGGRKKKKERVCVLVCNILYVVLNVWVSHHRFIYAESRCTVRVSVGLSSGPETGLYRCTSWWHSIMLDIHVLNIWIFSQFIRAEHFKQFMIKVPTQYRWIWQYLKMKS